MADDLSDAWSAIRAMQARLDRMEKSNPLESASVTGGQVRFVGGTLRVDEGGRVEIVGTLSVEGETDITGPVTISGALELTGAQTVKPGGSITVEGEYPIVLHNNGSGEALVEIGDGGIVGNESGLTLLAAGGTANVAIKADKLELNRGSKAIHLESDGIRVSGMPPRAAASTDRIVVLGTDGFLATVPIGSGGSGPGDPVDPTDPSKVFRWPFARDTHTTYPGHSGADWGRATGTPVRAIGDGVVEATYSFSGNTYPGNSSEPVWRGNCVVINHGGAVVRVSSLYAHLRDAPILGVGSVITAGQIIGYVGDTGYSNGSHLHFEVYFNGIRKSSGQGGYEQTISWMDANASGSWG